MIGLLAALPSISAGALPRGLSSANDNVSGVNDELVIAQRAGDVGTQRRHAWGILAYLSEIPSNQRQPRFQNWYGEEQVFGSSSAATKLPRGIRGFARPNIAPRSKFSDTRQVGDTPVITYTLYNDASFTHVRRKHLNKLSELTRLVAESSVDGTPVEGVSVPTFPGQAIVIKTVWWPIAPHGITAMPVWDPATNPPRLSGNGYLSWQRVVAVDPSTRPRSYPVQYLDFAGRSFQDPYIIPLEQFYHIKVAARMAREMMRDPETRRAAVIALGRAIKQGDYLVLVAANVATKEIEDWIWATFWWHDKPGEGPFASNRPDSLRGEWRNLLMQTAFANVKPLASDGGPHICFNPWLEGRFPDAGNGGGTVSNCLACHQRATFPATSFLPVTRGTPDYAHDPAFAAGHLRTGFLWSLAMHARP